MTDTTVTFKNNVELDDADQRKLKKMNDDMMACRQFVQTVQEQGEARLSQLQGSMRETWQGIAVKYDLELDKVSYELSDDGTKLVASGVRGV